MVKPTCDCLPVEYYFSSVCVYEDDEEFLFVEVNYCPRCGQKVEGVSSQTRPIAKEVKS